MNELRCERSFMMKPIGRLALPGVAASPLEVVQIIGGFGLTQGGAAGSTGLAGANSSVNAAAVFCSQIKS